MEMDWRLREGAVRLRKVDTGCERTEGREGLVFFEWNDWYTYSTNEHSLLTFRSNHAVTIAYVSPPSF